MKRFDVAAALLAAVLVGSLTGCDFGALRVDPLDINGRDGAPRPIGYESVMRIGAAAHAGGDLATALGLYRRAANVDPLKAAPMVGAGNVLMEMGETAEAIVSFNAALSVGPKDPEALRGLARGYLLTGKPELAGKPLSVAFRQTPDDPKLLQLIGVADDFSGQHEEAQARYRRGLELLPGDPGLSLNLALSLALTGDYGQAVAVLGPVAHSPGATPRERQTLALIHGLQGDVPAAERMGLRDLPPGAVQRNLAFYDTLRRLSPEARARAIQSLTTRGTRAS